MICPICKAETNDNTKFCTKCGKLIPRCPTCGKVVETRARFCVGDGTQLPPEVLDLLPASGGGKAVPVPPKPVPVPPKPMGDGTKPKTAGGSGDGAAVPPKKPETPPIRTDDPPRSKRFCTQCGGICEDGQSVCAKCRGARKPEPVRRSFCIKCGKPCAEGKNLCVECRSRDRSSGRYQKEKKGNGVAIVVGVIVLVLLLIVGAALYFILRDDDSPRKDKDAASTSTSWKDREEEEDSPWRSDDEAAPEVEEPVYATTEPVEVAAPEIETSAPTEAPTEPPVDVTSVEYRMEYFMNNCSSEYFDEDYFEDFNAEECRLVRNAIYAHSGRKFNDASLQAYYEQFDWYEPRIDPANFSGSMLNEYQLANVNAILNFEAAHGYN